MFRLIWRLASIAFVFGVGYLFGVLGVRFYRIGSDSMEPTLVRDDCAIAVKPGKLCRGDIVALKDPKGSREILVKRVIGLPGDRIKMARGVLCVNGKRIAEPYIREPAAYDIEWEIPEDKCVLLGDNRNESEDSSIWGPVSLSLVSGRVVLRYWPWRRFTVFFRGRSLLSLPERIENPEQ